LGGGVGALARYRQTGGSGMGFGDRVYDALRQRSAALRPEGVMGRIHDAGSAMAQVGTSAVLSQLPSSISRAANSFRRGSKPTTAQRLKESARARDAIQSRIKDRFGEAAAQGLDFSKWNFSRRPEESFDEAVERHLDRFQRQEQNKKDVGDIKNTIQARIKDKFGETVAQNLDYENWNFSRRPEESLDKAVDRHLDRFQRQAWNAKDTSDIRDQLLKAYGEKDASQVYIDPKRNWNLPQDESRADAIALAARLAYSRSRMLSDVGAVRKAAQAIVGPERADKINWGEVRPLTLKKGQDQESAAKDYAMTLLYKARAFTPEETKAHDHAALRREMARKMGGEEKISGIKIPDEWRVQARPGQKREDAIRGSALALLQHLGKIDRAGENRVAEVHSVRARTRKKKGPATTPNTPQA
ncbi:MAG TPA: hypothetical protein VK465_02255, partial [Fibrobacteria bacterium]|nr:hypothetical protein [Fibrobacteria bacterium]